ncbi:MAG: phenylalanine--tRNA ligase subunit alpha [Desulfobacterales bacterium]|nr:phenylalanine--tRNA ligase subunit alpha [Desulfobacterales bacterium]
MKQEIQQIQAEAQADLATAQNEKDIEAVAVRYLGRKGALTGFLRNIAKLPPEERAAAGKQANAAKQSLETAVRKAREELERRAPEKTAAIDISLPGRPAIPGHTHPISQIMQEICSILERMGFSVAEGPEVETDYYNFEALNVPKYHPARDMQDTFYISENIVLRTQTSPMQIRAMENQTPPVAVIAPGKVFRCDSDLTHTPMFHQVEGLLVDENISFADLKGTLTAFVHAMFDRETALRFRPSFFPFTEPSAEVDILCVMCRGKGCRVCGQSGWLEILGSGMVHPNVFRSVGYDTQRFTGFAFGMGVERIAMLKYGIDDIRKFFNNDMRFLGQF